MFSNKGHNSKIFSLICLGILEIPVSDLIKSYKEKDLGDDEEKKSGKT